MWKKYAEITIYGEPVATQRVRFDSRRKVAYTASKTRTAMTRRVVQIRNYISRHGLQKIEKIPVSVEVCFWYTRPKRLCRKKDSVEFLWKTTKSDLDNLTKLIKDCCTQAGLWTDDNLVVHEIASKKWTPLDADRKPQAAKTVIIVSTLGN